MTLEWVVLLITIWIICAVCTLGITVAYFQERFPPIKKETYWGDVKTGIILGVMGPLALIMTYFLSEKMKYGWYIKYRPVEDHAKTTH